jgi:hypothetical protein
LGGTITVTVFRAALPAAFRHAQRDRVDAPVAAAAALDAQAGGATVGADHDVAQRVAVAVSVSTSSLRGLTTITPKETPQTAHA